jgi:hypothetical protein
VKVYLMISEHFSNPGIVTRVCGTREKAVSEAVSCVNIMLIDMGIKPIMANEGDLQAALMHLHSVHGTPNCYADIEEHDVI